MIKFWKNIDALGHEWGAWKQTKAPTAAEEGEETRTCSRCGEKETRSISRSGDDKKDDANTDDRKDEGRKSGGKDRSSGSRSSSASGSIGGHAQGQWRLAADGWHFDLLGGSQATGWQNILYNGRYGWYYFNENGLMQTGWIDNNGSRYYLNPVSDGWKGEMFTGWHLIDGKWYYFETMPGHNQGHMYVDTVTPDGYYCGADGAWDGMPAGSGR